MNVSLLNNPEAKRQGNLLTGELKSLVSTGKISQSPYSVCAIQHLGELRVSAFWNRTIP
jgi:hypothetical protein